MNNKPLIGRHEIIHLPALHLFGLRAKVDTGAYTSAIHCHSAEIVWREEQEVLHCKLLDPSHPKYNPDGYYFDEYTVKRIKNSFGQAEKRYIIKTTVQLFDRVIATSFSLSDRSRLKFPILLGRKLLNNNFIIDTAKKNLSHKNNEK